MADVRCPMCGKPNSADREICQFCSARLKPLIAPGQAPSSSGNDLPDWLAALQSDSSPTDAVSGAPDSDSPDWLSKIRDRAKEDGVQPEEPTLPGWGEEPAGQDVPDWLSGLRSEGQSSTPDSDDGADWLNSMRGEQASAGFSASESEPASNDNNDWLASLGGGAFTESPDAPEQQPSSQTDNPFAAGASEWLSSSDTPGPGSEESSSFNASEPFSWGDDAASNPNDSGKDSSERDSDIPAFNWNEPAAETPAASSEPAASPWEGEALPDWLSSPPSNEAPASGAQSFNIPDQQNLPDWLSAESASAGAGAEPEAKPRELPDWLSAPTPEQPIADNVLSAEAGELPDWLSGAAAPGVFGVVGTSGGSEDEKDSGAPRLSDTPNWLSNLEASAAANAAEDRETEAAPQEEGLPDWLSSAPEASFENQQAVEDTEQASEPDALPAEDLPDWLRAGQPQAFQAENEQPAEEPFARENFDWLANVPQSSQSQPPVASESQEGDEISIAPAELPNWVQAMRPVESVTPDAPVPQGEVDERVERSGPLAGLQGVLPAEALAGPMKKPGLYSVKLQVSEQQQVNMALMENIVASESEPQPFTRQRPFPAQSLLRFGIAIVLLAAVILAVLGGGGFTETPGILPPELASVNNAVERLPAESIVLVAVDYDAALSGELEAAALSALSSLVNRPANIALLSTNPTGPALAEHLLDKTLAKATPAEFDRGQRVINLGYLSGGPVGLLTFALQPQNTLPFTTAMQPAWSDSSFLAGVTGLADFDQVILITDSANTTRDWVEQVKPSMGSQPLYVISSAQAAPMISPYIDSGQVAGMVSGVSGGTVFEEISGHPGAGSAYWDAYQAGLAVMIVLILIGGIVGLAQSLINSGKENKDRA